MSVVRDVGGVCGMCLAWAEVGGVVGDRIGFGLYQFWRNMGKVGYVSVFCLRWCVCRGVGGEWVGGLVQGLGGWGGVMNVCVMSLDSLC